jgi:hypothetical protein
MESTMTERATVSDILDLIDGALDDYLLSEDAMRWQPEPDVAAELHAQAMAYGQATLYVTPDGHHHASAPSTEAMTAYMAPATDQMNASIERYRTAWEEAFRHFPQRWVTRIPDPSGVHGQLHASTPGDDAALVANTFAAGNWPDAPTEWATGGAVASGLLIDETHSWFAEPNSGCTYVIPNAHTAALPRHILDAALVRWYGSAVAGAIAREHARSSDFVLGFDGSQDADSTALIATVRRNRCAAHHESEEPADPMARALWLRRNRNTGPRRPARAPKRIDARGTR